MNLISLTVWIINVLFIWIAVKFAYMAYYIVRDEYLKRWKGWKKHD